MVYISWVTLLAGFIFGFRNNLILALSALFGGVILFVSGLNWMDPQINSLVPVLKSPWLMFHVAVIVAAYGFFGVSFLLGTTNLLLMSLRNRTKQIQFRIKELTLINHLSLMGDCIDDYRYFLGCCGQTSHGKILGMGSQRNLGIDYCGSI